MNLVEKDLDTERQDGDRWLISYADLMTLLLALFIVLYAASDKERAAKISESFNAPGSGNNGILPGNRPSENEASQIAANFLQDRVLQSKTRVYKKGGDTVISLTEAGFFAPGMAELKDGGDEVLSAIAESLKKDGSFVRIEGHTDSTPISTEKYRSNWELSTARASTVLEKLIERGVEPRRLSAAGYGGYQPIGDNSTESGRARNRRVDVIVLKNDSN
ncbi:MAG: OmpA family protein [Pyrinomonadaceae bacterium]|nr:OmpA family protein [Pyrinomonadaceae bacterium]